MPLRDEVICSPRTGEVPFTGLETSSSGALVNKASSADAHLYQWMKALNSVCMRIISFPNTMIQCICTYIYTVCI